MVSPLEKKKNEKVLLRSTAMTCLMSQESGKNLRRLEITQKRKSSLSARTICKGLDPHLASLPQCSDRAFHGG